MTDVFIEREDLDPETHLEEWQCEGTQEKMAMDWSDASVPPRVARAHQKLEDKESFFPGVLREHNSADTLLSVLLAFTVRQYIFVLSHWVFGTLLQQPSIKLTKNIDLPHFWANIEQEGH